MQAEKVQTELEAARAEAAKLAAELATHEQALAETRTRLDAAVSRGNFSKAIEDGAWLAHLIDLQNKKIEAHRTDVLLPLESQAAQGLREHEAALVLAARIKAEEAFTAAGKLAGEAVRAIAAAVDAIGAFDAAQREHQNGASIVSPAPLRMSAIIPALNMTIGAPVARYQEMHAHGGEIQLHVTFPIRIPQTLR